MGEFLFYLKKIIGSWIKPLPLSVLLMLIGGLLLWRQRQRWGRRCLATGVALLLLFSNGWVAQKLVAPLEQWYPQYQGQTVDYILVLGGLHHSADNIPSSSILERDTLHRLIEGLRIARLNPGAKLILSGYAFDDDISNAEAYRRVALSLGVEPARLLLMEEPKDTGEELSSVAKIVGESPMALVTSAYHMPRSMALAQHEQLDAVAAPTWHQYKPDDELELPGLLPTPAALDISQRAVHEYIGMVWYRLTGRL